MRLMTRPRRAPAPDLMPVVGFVVVVVQKGKAPQHLTCSDLLDREGAEYEVKAWREHARERGNRLMICPVVKDWGVQVVAAMEDDDDTGD